MQVGGVDLGRVESILVVDASRVASGRGPSRFQWSLGLGLKVDDEASYMM